MNPSNGLILAASVAAALSVSAMAAPNAEAGWKLCVAQTCHMSYYGQKRICTNKLVECPSSGEHVSTWTSSGKGSNW